MRWSRAWGAIGGVAVLIVALLPGTALAAPASPYNVLVAQAPGVPTLALDSSNSTFAVQYLAPTVAHGNRELLIWSAGTANITYGAKIASAPGQLLTANTSYSSSHIAAWALLGTDAPACSSILPQFTVHDLTRDAQNAITSIAVSVQYPTCGLTGELRYNSSTGYTAWDVSPQVDLGTIDVHASGPVYATATVTGLGSDPTTLGATSVGDDASGTFSIAAGGTCTAGVTLAYGQTCTVRIAAKAVPALGTYTANLTVADTTGHSRVSPVHVRDTLNPDGNFYPTGPTRLVDTRTDGSLGYPTMSPGSYMVLNPVPGASALVLNVTAVNASVEDFLTVYPALAGPPPPPTASSINFPKGAVEANSVTVGNGPYGIVVSNHAGTVDVVVDLVGTYAVAGDGTHDSDTRGGQYFPHTPTRVLDTRTGLGQVPANHEVVVPVDYGPQADPHVRALAVNVTATNPHGSGFLTVNGAATDAVDNHTSTLNYTANATVANMAIIPTIAVNGVPTIRVANNAATGVDIVVDVLGYYDDGLAVGGLRYHAVAPTRILDTRQTHPIGAGGTLAVTGPTAHALSLNVTGVQPTTNTFLTVWPAGGTRPSASTLNLNPGEIRSNATITGLTNGQFDVYNFFGSTNVVVDVNGTFDPLPGTTAPTVAPPTAGTPHIGP